MPLGKRADCKNAKYAGIWPSRCANVCDGIQEAFQVGFDFVAVSLNHEKLGTGVPGPHTCIRSDLDLQSQSWTSQVVGIASAASGPAGGEDCMGAGGHECGGESRRSELSAVLEKEFGWASYLGLQAVILPSVASQSEEEMPLVAQAVSQAMMSKTFLQVWVQVPVALDRGEHGRNYDKWHCIRALSNYHQQVRLALVLGEDLPEPSDLDVWTGEPVRSAIVPVSAFKFNAKGYPTLPKGHQNFLRRLFRMGVQVIVRDDALGHRLGADAIKSAQDPENNPLRVYWEYLSFLFRGMEQPTENEAAELDYRDYLQSPLQPLQDHLESATYEVFERDQTKYTTYEEAVYRALLDKFPGGASGGRTPVLMVVGAGRGPLVLASLRASKRAKVGIKVYAVEKNPNAYITLLHLHQKEKWGDTVTIVHQDMRHWNTTERADIMVSELLGSFGDNELSPECLDGAQRFLAEDGVSIPQSYTSYLAPISTSKLHEEIRNLKELKLMETPYVVKLFAHTLLAENQEVFRFDHPNRAEVVDNERFRTLHFERPAGSGPGILHGFAGYFESVLYKDVLLSIRPETHTPNMFSWFPIFFPLARPVYLGCADDGGGRISVHVWRRSARHKVWYEYALASPEVHPLVNPEGRSYAAEL
ncbi:protein arginine N-methyltransferase [Chloropicon primus]|uniref:Protein arginine N-methyltransferase n=2 Tax=Chloropicon primus TaxID=1764295 RepID=A0A5B8MXK0_9CHLO|nr:protein arginine N-methyltransferase [Chloropicon primus]UPR03633.1 protein arginine N-methyltransferase [Chloropicon primus]|eukprot:QDZ24425.1 protein arginine N-methyltransferase [Chloropicon primus]